MKKIILSLAFCLAFAFLFGQTVNAQTASKDVNIYFFWGDGCPHCANEKIYLEYLRDKYPFVTLYDYEVYNNGENKDLLKEIGSAMDMNIAGVPFTVIGEKYFIGWSDNADLKLSMEETIKCAQENKCGDVIAQIAGITNPVTNGLPQSFDDYTESHGEEIPIVEDENLIATAEEKPLYELTPVSLIPETIKVPIIGEINIKNLSLPIITIIFGALDGFNPCAMWVLLFLISMLMGMENKKRMWILGIAFLVASASVYYIFMAAWLNLLLFIGFIFWIRVGIGAVALLGGGFNLKEYFKNPEGACKVTGTEKRQKVFQRLKEITQQKSFWLALIGIILLAFAVNLVELVCSAGLPAVYTQILALSNLPTWQYYAYIGLYILVFLLDDLIVFFVAMTTLHITGATSKYSRFSHLIGGILMIIIGLLLIFKPGWLMFG
jgi:thiol-disulfide isomerase/thioredoxin